MLGATTNPRFWAADHTIQAIARKLGRVSSFRPSEIGIFFGSEEQTIADPYCGGSGPEQAGCIHCGGCMVGCRHNAKNTLPKNYLYFSEKQGAKVVPEAEAIAIRPVTFDKDARYEVFY